MSIYLDNSATTRPCPEAVAAMTSAMTEGWHNPSALYRPAMDAEKKMNAVREACLAAAGAKGQKLYFTGSGTEADNLAILGHLRTVKHPGRVLILGVEHPAVLQCEEEIRRLGHQVTELTTDASGVLDLDAFERELNDQVVLICLMQVNNESGAIQPIREAAVLRDRLAPKAAIHCDGVQGFLRVPVEFNRSGIQSYAFSGHKIHACKGIGGLIVRNGHRVTPVVYGGGQEEGMRSGTENTPGIAALGAAVAAFPTDAAQTMQRQKTLLWHVLKDAIPGAVLNGPEPGSPFSAPHILNVSIPPVRSQTMLFALEGDGIYVSAGSACASHKQKVSATLVNMGVSRELADCALRFSLCPGMTDEELLTAASCVKKQYDLLSKYVRR